MERLGFVMEGEIKRILIAAGVAALATAGHAQIFDNTAFENGTSIRNAGDGPALQITNTNAGNVTLTAVAFSGQTNATQQFDFFLANGTGNVQSQVFATEGITGPHTLIGTSVNWTLAAGQTYFIGAMSQSTTVFFDYIFPSNFTGQNGLVPSQNGNFTGYGAPVKGFNGGAEMAWQLQGSAVPEPATMLAMGLGVVGLVARRRRK